MSSPLQVFRHYQKQIMVVVTLLAVFAFVAADAVMQNSALIIPFLGGLVGMALFYVIGQKYDQQWIYAALGAVLGFVLASFAPTGPSQAIAVRTNVGDYSNIELQESIRNVMLANQLINEFRAKAFGFRFPQSVFVYSNTPEGNGLMSQLLLHEAKQQGVTISDEMVNDFINNSTAQRLTSQDFFETIRQFQLSRDKAFDIIRDQLAASTIMQIKQPTLLRSTSGYWNSFRKLNEQQEMKVVAVPVSQFTDKVTDPTDQQIAEFFEAHKATPSSTDASEPSFFQPDRVKLAYLEASYDAVAETIDEPTDEELLAYYEANKNNYVINPFDQPSDPAPAPPGDAPTNESAESTETPETTAPAQQQQAKPEPAKPEQAKPEETPAAPEQEKKTETQPETSEPAAKPEPETPQPETSEEPEGSETSEDSTSQLIRFPDGVLASLLQEEPATEQPETKPEAADTESNAADKPVETPVEAPKPEEKPAEETTEKPATEQTQTPVEEMPAETSTSTLPEGFEPPKKPEVIEQMQPTYRELDDDLKAEIRETLIQQKTMAKMAGITSEASGVLIDLASRFIGYRMEDDVSSNEEWLTDAEIQQKMQEYAKQHKLRYAETGWLSAQELAVSEDHPIGSSTEPSENEFRRAQARSVVDQVFSYAEKPEFYNPQFAEDPISLNRFVHWTLDFEPGHEPTLEEPGVREQVVLAWKLKQAEELAQKRAEEIAEMLKTSDKTWAETIAGTTVDGTETSGALGISYTGPFSWYRMASSPNPQQFQPTVELSSPPGIIGGATEELMNTVFNDLQSGEVGVVWSQGKTNALVVQAENRTPQEELQTRFMAEAETILGRGSVYDMLPNTEGQELFATWQDQFFKHYNVQWSPVAPQ